MAAGPVGIAVGVFGGMALLRAGSDLFLDRVAETVDAMGFKLSCFGVGLLLPGVLAANDSQLSLCGGLTAEAVSIDRTAERGGRGCISGFARRSGPESLGSLKGFAAATAPRSAFGPVGG